MDLTFPSYSTMAAESGDQMICPAMFGVSIPGSVDLPTDMEFAFETDRPLCYYLNPRFVTSVCYLAAQLHRARHEKTCLHSALAPGSQSLLATECETF